jgi:hydroxymethylbilane synthase
VVASEDGRELIKEQVVSPMDKVKAGGRALADRVLDKGGKKILESLNSNGN